MEKVASENRGGRYRVFSASNKNLLVLLAVLLVVLSAAARVAYYSPPRDGYEGVGTPLFALFFIVIPILSSLAFAYELIFNGRYKLYRSSRAVWLFAVFLTARIIDFSNKNDPRVLGWWHIALCVAGYILLAFIYRMAVNTGGVKREKIAPRRLIALLAFIIAFVCEAVFELLPRFLSGDGLRSFLGDASVAAANLAVILVLLAVKEKTAERPLPMAGDRNDGRRLRTLDPLNGVAVYIMPDRAAASNQFRDSIDCAKAEAYIKEKREQGLDGFGYIHLFLAGYARTASQRPAVNRFISGQRIYSRGDELEVSMAIKKDMSAEASETIITVYLTPEDTAETVYHKFNAEVEKVKATSELDSSFDKLAGALNLIPGVFMKLTVWLLKTADYFGLLPRRLTRLSPFHGSMFITSIGSLGIPPIHHHLYDFGNIPVFVAFGMKRSVNELQPDGSVIRRKYIDFTVNTDERICDGFYFASAFKYFKRCIMDPHRLDTPPEEIFYDVD